jgi:hypothetical protein
VPPPREPTDEELATSVEAVRSGVRQQADLFDHLASIAADGGDLQSVYRALAAHLRAASDGFTVAQLTTDDYALRQDVLSIYLLNTTIRVGEYSYPRVGAILESIVRAGNDRTV